MEPVTLTIDDVRKLEFRDGKTVTITLNCSLVPREIGILAELRASGVHNLKIMVESLQAAFDRTITDCRSATDPRQGTLPLEGALKPDPIIAEVGQKIADAVGPDELVEPLTLEEGPRSDDDGNSARQEEGAIVEGWAQGIRRYWHWFTLNDEGVYESECGKYNLGNSQDLIAGNPPEGERCCKICATCVAEKTRRLVDEKANEEALADIEAIEDDGQPD